MPSPSRSDAAESGNSKAAKKGKHAWVTHDDLNVAPDLLGLPLASPWRRLMAIAVDLAVIVLVSKYANLLLLSGMVLATWLLARQRPTELLRRKMWLLALAWTAAAVMLALGAIQLWSTRGSVGIDLEKADRVSLSIGGKGVTDTATSAASATPVAAVKAASSPEALQDKVTELEDALEEASKPKKSSLRSAVASWSDDLGFGQGLGWTVLYFSALPVWWKGQTLGKRLFKLRVVELTGKPMTLMLAFKRYGAYAAGVSTGLFGFLQVLWDSNRQALHDKAAHTVVLDLTRARKATRRLPEAAAQAVNT